MSPLFKGAVIGFSIAAPVGPIGVLCIRRSIADGRLAGFVSGLGAATADAVYGLVAALGLTAVSQILLDFRLVLQTGGGIFMLYLGVAAMRTRRPAAGTTAGNSGNLAAVYGSTFLLTLANPMTILSFAGIFVGLGVGSFSGFPLVLGVFLGSAGWWLLLSTVAGWVGDQLQQEDVLRSVDLAAGGIIASFGLWQLFQVGQ